MLRHLNKSRASEVLSKETVATKTSKVDQTEVPTGHMQKPEIRTHSRIAQGGTPIGKGRRCSFSRLGV